MKSRTCDSGWSWVAGQLVLTAAVVVLAPWRRSELPVGWIWGPGALLLAYAVWTGLSGVRALGKNLTPLPSPKSGATLVTRGIYARMRHPLYASVIAFGFGWALVWGSGTALGLAVVLTGFIHAKARHEERLLAANFPEYPAYCRRVPRYLPTFRQPEQTT